MPVSFSGLGEKLLESNTHPGHNSRQYGILSLYAPCPCYMKQALDNSYPHLVTILARLGQRYTVWDGQSHTSDSKMVLQNRCETGIMSSSKYLESLTEVKQSKKSCY